MLKVLVRVSKSLLPSATDKQPSHLWKGIMPSEHISLFAVSLRLSMHLLIECSLAEFPARNAPQPSALSLVPCLHARGLASSPPSTAEVFGLQQKGNGKNLGAKGKWAFLCYISFYFAVLHFQINFTSCCKHAQMECGGVRAAWEEQLHEGSAG